jgi:formate dehydrogenase subunit gamma
MYSKRVMRWLMRVLVLLCVTALAQGSFAADTAKEQAARQITQPGNNAPMWRDVRRGEPGPYTTTQVRGVETNVLVETGGQLWREVRNGPVTVYGGWLIAAMFLFIAGFYAVYGAMKLRAPLTGRKIQRFSAWERIVHWTAAITFIVLACTGMITLFGRYILLPVTGYTLFSWLATISKSLHNFTGPLFAVCLLLMIATFIRDNWLKAYDWIWARRFGGLIGGKDVPSGRFNLGEKGWFWGGVVVLGIAVSASGFILDFSNFGQGRVVMQVTNIVHAIAAVLFITMSFGHIYLGTIGVQGAYGAMREGVVDETWAKEHHEYWYNEVVANQGRAPGTGAAPSTAPASSMKEGWKL